MIAERTKQVRRKHVLERMRERLQRHSAHFKEEILMRAGQNKVLSRRLALEKSKMSTRLHGERGNHATKKEMLHTQNMAFAKQFGRNKRRIARSRRMKKRLLNMVAGEMKKRRKYAVQSRSAQSNFHNAVIHRKELSEVLNRMKTSLSKMARKIQERRYERTIQLLRARIQVEHGLRVRRSKMLYINQRRLEHAKRKIFQLGGQIETEKALHRTDMKNLKLRMQVISRRLLKTHAQVKVVLSGLKAEDMKNQARLQQGTKHAKGMQPAGLMRMHWSKRFNKYRNHMAKLHKNFFQQNIDLAKRVEMEQKSLKKVWHRWLDGHKWELKTGDKKIAHMMLIKGRLLKAMMGDKAKKKKFSAQMQSAQGILLKEILRGNKLLNVLISMQNILGVLATKFEGQKVKVRQAISRAASKTKKRHCSCSTAAERAARQGKSCFRAQVGQRAEGKDKAKTTVFATCIE